MRTKRFLAGTGAGVTTLALMVGCAQQVRSLEPKLELRGAAQHLAEAKQAGFTLSLTGSADDLIAGLTKQDGAMSADDVTQLRTLAGSSVSIAYDLAGDGAADDRMSLAATVGGVGGTELRVLDRTLYAKAPVSELVKKLGASDTDVAELRRGVTTESPSFTPFLDGGWIAVDVEAAGKTYGNPAQNMTADKTLAEVKTSAQNLVDGAAIARDPADDTHLIVTSSTTTAYAEVKRLVTTVAGEQSPALTEELDQAPADRPVLLDLWIDDEKLTAVEVDLLQFIDGAAGRAAVRLEVTTGAPIEAPADATKIDTDALGTLGATGAYVSEPGGTSAVSMAKMLGYEAQDLAEENGGKPADALKGAVKAMDGAPFTARIVRRGVAEVTVKGEKACLTVPNSVDDDPAVVKGAC